MQYILNKMMDLRLEQSRRLMKDPNLTIGDVTSVNLTKTHGGVQSNVVPSQLMICFDIRLALDVDHDQFEVMVSVFMNLVTFKDFTNISLELVKSVV